MARVTDIEVAGIIDVDSSIDLTPFINTASSLVDELCSGVGYDETRLKLIELWLAAHFYAIRDPRTTGEGIAGVSVSFQGSTGMNLASTSYGQQAMLLDTAGALSRLNRGIATGLGRVGVYWLGQEENALG